MKCGPRFKVIEFRALGMKINMLTLTHIHILSKLFPVQFHRFHRERNCEAERWKVHSFLNGKSSFAEV